MASISGADMYETPSYLRTPPNGAVRKGAYAANPLPVDRMSTALARQTQAAKGYTLRPAMPRHIGMRPHAGLIQNPAYGNVGAGLAVGAGVLGLVGLVLLPGFVIYPWIIKQFKPKWGYGKRVATGLAIGYGTKLIKDVLTPAEVKLAREQALTARLQAIRDRQRGQ